MGANIAAGLDAGFRDSTCVSCGACADTCPTDAITEITLLRYDRTSAIESNVSTTCGYCGVGCRLEAHVSRGRIASISPALDGPANEGHTCLKGRFAHQFSRSRERLTAPLVREGEGFRLASWEEAITRIAGEFGRIKAAHGPDAIAGLASSRATNEDCYAMARFMRATIGTNNIDNCSRVCHSPTSFALRRSLGLSGATGSFSDIDFSDAGDRDRGQPDSRATRSSGRGSSRRRCAACALVTIDPRRIELADYGVLHLAPRPGTNAAVMLGLCHVVRPRRTARRAASSASAPRAMTSLEELLGLYAPDAVEEITGVPAADIEAAAHIYGEAENASIMWGLGVTEHLYGSEVVQLICNLALMCGKAARRGSALLPLRGQNNVQGSSDMGALPDTYTAYRSVTDERGRTHVRGGLGRAALAREGLHDPADVRRRDRRAA